MAGFGFFAFIFNTASYLRYAFPAIPLFIVLIVVAVAYAKDINVFFGHILVSIVLVCFLLNLAFLGSAKQNYRDFPLFMVFDKTKRSDYMLWRRPIRSAIKYINDLSNSPKKIAVFAEPAVAGLHAEALLDNWYNFDFTMSVREIKSADSLVELLNNNSIQLLLASDYMRSPELLSIINQVSDLKERFGHITVRILKRSYLYQTEMIKNMNMDSTDSWSMSSQSEYRPESKTMMVNVHNPISQSIAVQAEKMYLMELTARCENGGSIRTQVNWHNADNKYISTSIKVQNCTNEYGAYKGIFMSPRDARHAIIYGISHDKRFAEIKRISFRK